MHLLVAPMPRVAGRGINFRDELMAQIFDRGDSVPKRTLTFNIEVKMRVSERRHSPRDAPSGLASLRDGRVPQRRLSFSGNFGDPFQPSDLADNRNDPPRPLA